MLTFTFDLLQNLLKITIYLGCVSDLDFSLLGCAKVKALPIKPTYAVTEDNLM